MRANAHNKFINVVKMLMISIFVLNKMKSINNLIKVKGVQDE